MGMFDHFICGVSCPICGRYLSDFQTKDLDNLLDTYRPGDIVDKRTESPIRVYENCIHMMGLEKLDKDFVYFFERGVCIEYEIPITDARIVEDQNLWVRNIENIEIETARFRGGMTNTEIANAVSDYNKKVSENIYFMRKESELRGVVNEHL